MFQLSSSPQPARWAHARLLALLLGVLGAAGALLAGAARWGLPAGRDTFAFMAAEVPRGAGPARGRGGGGGGRGALSSDGARAHLCCSACW